MRKRKFLAFGNCLLMEPIQKMDSLNNKEGQPDKKRKKHESEKEGENEVLEIDVTKPVPPSKKLMRKLRKAGKIDKDGNWTPEALEEAKKKEEKRLKRLDAKYGRKEEGESQEESKRSPWGIWVGNLSFHTTKEILTDFFVRETSEMIKEVSEENIKPITTEQITRIHMPMSKEKRFQNKGFAYVDFATEDALKLALQCSEKALNGRNILIKSNTDFSGRPSKPANTLSKTASIQSSKKEPSSILFVGNLDFETTDADLKEHFGQVGQIRRVRLMTFEDTGKCKGFGFVDFPDIDTCMKAMELGHNSWRLEYGEDRSKRMRNKSPMARSGRFNDAESLGQEDKPNFKRARKIDPRSVRPGAALAKAQRSSAAIVEPAGQKIKFD